MLKILCYGVLAGVWFLGGYLLGGWYHKTYETPLQRETQDLSPLKCEQRVLQCFRADPHDPTSDEVIIIPDPVYHSVYRQLKPNPKLESVMEECVR